MEGLGRGPPIKLRYALRASSRCCQARFFCGLAWCRWVGLVGVGVAEQRACAGLVCGVGMGCCREAKQVKSGGEKDR